MALRQEKPIVPSVLDQSTAGFHQSLLQAGQRPVVDLLRQRQASPQVSEAHHTVIPNKDRYFTDVYKNNINQWLSLNGQNATTTFSPIVSMDASNRLLDSVQSLGEEALKSVTLPPSQFMQTASVYEQLMTQFSGIIASSAVDTILPELHCNS